VVSLWAREEMASVDLGDERLDQRSAMLLSSLGNRPNLSIPSACGGRAEMVAAYRFFDNDNVRFDKLLAPHVQRTLQRLAEHPVALLVNDTTEIELMRPQQPVEGAGQLNDSRQGVLLHVLHAYTPDGTPQGTAAAQYLNRTDGVCDAPKAHKERSRKRKPIEQKESMRWLADLRQAREIAGKLPQTQCIYVADSEADIYELLCEPRKLGESDKEIDWLIRACQNRALACEGESEHRYLREQVLASPPLYEMELLIRARQAKTQVEERARRKKRDSRSARVEVRAATVTLRPPWRQEGKLPQASLQCCAGARVQSACRRRGCGMDPGDHAADPDAGAGAARGGVLLRPLEHRNPVQDVEVGMPHRAAAVRACRSNHPLHGVVSDRGVANAVCLSQCP